VGVLSVGYSLHRTSDLHKKAWIISGDVVDVTFGVIDPTNNGTPMGTTKPQNIFDPKKLFSMANPTQKSSLISTVPSSCSPATRQKAAANVPR